ncbi:hypothetical protein HZC27_01580 [Candidatus Roizmanbacteria bacterium]|nr:hypothetical protein [Candidatus Roizmanbacteria bacterium]
MGLGSAEAVMPPITTTPSRREAPRAATTPPPPPNHSTPSSQEDRLKIRETEEAAIEATNREIAEAKERNKSKTEAPETKAPIKTAPPPSASEVEPQLPPGVTPADIARLRQNVTDKVMTQQQAEAELERLVTQATGAPSETHTPPPVSQKKVAQKEVVSTPSKASSSPPTPPVEHKAENSFLSKIKNIVEKVFSIPAAIWHYLTGWIMK